MKARIIKETTSFGGQKVERYYVQYKRLLFWHYVSDAFESRVSFTLDRAQNTVKDLTFKTIREVI